MSPDISAIVDLFAGWPSWLLDVCDVLGFFAFLCWLGVLQIRRKP